MVEQFAKNHPHLDELAKPIMFWLGKGLDLDDAYLVADTLSRRQAIRRAIRRRT